MPSPEHSRLVKNAKYWVFIVVAPAMFVLLSAWSKSAANKDAHKFYVYSVPEDLLYSGYNMRPETCPHFMYSSEIVVPELIKRHKRLYVNDPEKASYFVVPQFSTCYYHFCLNEPGASTSACKQKTQDYLRDILDWVELNHRFWDAKGGTDHVFVFSWDQGSEILGSETIIANRVSSSIHLVHHGKRGKADQNHSPTKDVVIPVYRDYGPVDRMVRKMPTKSIFAFFRGTILDDHDYGNGIRRYIRHLGKTKPETYFVKEGHGEFYWNEIVHATFTLCPGGWSVWSPRLYDAVMANSVPVVFGDEWVLPFEQIVDYDSFIVRIDPLEVKSLDRILSGMGQQEIALKVAQMNEYKDALRYNDVPEAGDAIDNILNEIVQRHPHPGHGLRDDVRTQKEAPEDD